MVQVLEKDKENISKKRIILEEIIVFEELPMEEEQLEKAAIVKREKKPKKALLKLLKKAKYNANYLKDSISIDDVKYRIHFRNHAVY